MTNQLQLSMDRSMKLELTAVTTYVLRETAQHTQLTSDLNLQSLSEERPVSSTINRLSICLYLPSQPPPYPKTYRHQNFIAFGAQN